MADPHTHMGKEQESLAPQPIDSSPPVTPSPPLSPSLSPSPPLSCASASAAPSLLLRLSAHSTQQEESTRNTQTTQQAEQKQEENTQSSESAAIPTYAAVSTRRLRSAAASASPPVSLSPFPPSHPQQQTQTPAQTSSSSSLTGADLQSLLPSSAVPLSSVCSSPSVPAVLRSALQQAASQKGHASSDRLSRERLLLSVFLAVQAAHGQETLFRPWRELAAADSEAAVPAGSGVPTRSIQEACRSLGFTASKHTSVSAQNKIDRATRVLLCSLLSARDATMLILGPLYEASLPAACSDSIRLSTLHAASIALPESQEVTQGAAVSPPAAARSPSPSLSFPPSAAVHPHPTRCVVQPMSAVGNQCWYRAVSTGLAMSIHKRRDDTTRKTKACFNQLSALLRLSLDQIDSIEMLNAIGIGSGRQSDTLDELKQRYLSSDHFQQQCEGGTVEMQLLLYYFKGELSFVVFDPLCSSEPVRRYTYSALCEAAPASHPPARPTLREVALHHCSFGGLSEQSNHYDLLLLAFDAPDVRQFKQWTYVQQESDSQRQHRDALMLEAARHNQQVRQMEMQKRLQRDEELARALASPPRASSLKKISTPARSKSEGRRYQLHPPMPHSVPRAASSSLPVARSVSAAATSSTPFTPSSYAPFQRRLNVWREIPSSCRNHFLNLAAPLFEAYAKHSAAERYERCAQLLHHILDLPGQALLKGKSGWVKELKQTLEQQTVRLKEYGLGLESSPCPPVSAQLPINSPSLPLTASSISSISQTVVLDSSAPPPSLSLPLTAVEEEEPPSESAVDDEDDEADEDPLAANIKRAVAIVRGGGARCLTRACSALAQSAPAPIDEATLSRLRELHPAATESMPPVPTNKAIDIVAVDSATLLTLIKRRVNNGSAPGLSGWTGSHLQLIADSGREAAVSGLCLLVKDIANGVFGGATKQRLLASVLVPIAKSSKAGDIRPIAMGEVFVKLASHYLMSLIEDQLPSLFPRIQFGVKRPGGSESAAQLTRAVFHQSLQSHPDTIVLKTDFQNAFNSCSRAGVWRALMDNPSTEPIWRMFHWTYSTPSSLLVFERGGLRSTLQSSEGVRQGCPFAAFGFALGVQPLYERCILGRPECHAVSIQDDLSLIGPSTQVFAAFDYIQQHAAAFSLTLRVNKCAVYVPASLTDHQLRSDIEAGCQQRLLAHGDSMETLGVMIGESSHVQSHAMAAVDSADQLFRCIEHQSMPLQIALQLLRQCLLPRLSFLARTVPPAEFHSAAAAFDVRIMQSLHRLIGFSGLSRPDDTSEEQLQKQITLPIKAGGMGLRPMQRVSHAAYFASAVSILPDFLRAFPSSVLPDPQATRLHAELESCLTHLQRQGVGNTALDASPPAPLVKPKRAGGISALPRPSIPRAPAGRQTGGTGSDNGTGAAGTGTTRSRGQPMPVQLTPNTSTLSQPASALWQKASVHSSSSSSSSFLGSEKLQREATFQLEDRTLHPAAR